MSETMFVVLWLLCGLIGCVQLWVAEKWFDAGLHGDPEWCPTPRAILFAVLGSVAGMTVMFAGTIMIVCTSIQVTRWQDNWFTRPICRGRDDK